MYFIHLADRFDRGKRMCQGILPLANQSDGGTESVELLFPRQTGVIGEWNALSSSPLLNQSGGGRYYQNMYKRETYIGKIVDVWQGID